VGGTIYGRAWAHWETATERVGTVYVPEACGGTGARCRHIQALLGRRLAPNDGGGALGRASSTSQSAFIPIQSLRGSGSQAKIYRRITSFSSFSFRMEVYRHCLVSSVHPRLPCPLHGRNATHIHCMKDGTRYNMRNDRGITTLAAMPILAARNLFERHIEARSSRLPTRSMPALS